VQFGLLTAGEAHAQILPGAPSLLQRINIAPYVGGLSTNSQNLKGPELALGFTAEATIFTYLTCTLCPNEIGAGTAYLATNERTQVQDSAWLATYWFLPKSMFLGIQGGYSKFTASAVDANDANKTVFLEADGVRGAATVGYHPSILFVELAVAGRYFPAPKAVTAPLSSSPFGAISVGINFGVTFSGADQKAADSEADQKAAEQKVADAARRAVDEQRWAEEKEFRRLQMESWKKEDEARKAGGSL
jgi:hypothetical protein